MLGILLNEWDVGCIIKWVDKKKGTFLECRIYIFLNPDVNSLSYLLKILKIYTRLQAAH